MVTHILVVDDDPLNRRLAEIILTSEGYSVELSSTAQQALECISVRQPHLIVLDLGLPDIHGLQLLERLKDQRPDIPVLVVTGDTSLPARSAELKAAEYLMKPYDPDSLLHAVATLTNHND